MSKKTAYKDLTPEQVEYIKHVYYTEATHKEKMDVLSTKFGVGERSIRAWWKKLDLNKISSDLPIQLQKAQERSVDRDTEVLLVTTAQNKTAVHKDFLHNLEAYRDYITTVIGKKCQIVVVPSRYRNPTNNIEDEKTKSQDWWCDEVDPYLFYGKVDFGGTVISCDSHISPTAKDPISGYEILASDNHLVLGHSKIHFKTLPRFRNAPLRAIATTGYITFKNYSRSKAGEVAMENHAYGLVVVEQGMVPRNVKVKSDGSFIDIVNSVKNNSVSKINKSLGFVWGDFHAQQINMDFFNETKKLLSIFKPEINIIHDALDAGSVNPHEAKDMFIQRQKILNGENLLDKEIEHCLKLIGDIKGCCGEVVCIESNHDFFIDRHINDFQWKKDLHNSPEYLRLAYIQQTVNLKDYGNIFGYLLFEKFGGDVKYIKMGDSLYIGSYQCGQHNDFAANGSKGSTKGFGRMNLKLIGGHSHSPMLFNNVTTVGVTCNLNQWYNRKGLSSWAYSHSIIHENDKNQLLVFNDDYTLSRLIC